MLNSDLRPIITIYMAKKEPQHTGAEEVVGVPG